MPRPKIEYIVADESSEDDEVEVIPYVKPAPVVIDLLESDHEMPEETKKTPKKKKRRKVAAVLEGSNDVASHDNLPSTSCSEQNSKIPSTAEGCRELSGQVVGTGIRVNHVSGSFNVAGTSSATSSIRTSVVQQISLLDEAFSSSSFERCDDAQSKHADGGIMTDALVEGTPSNSKEKRSRSKEKKMRGEGKPRSRKISATQRTNEEIVNFLTTLGIEMEASAFDSPTKKRRQSKKRPCDVNQEINPEALSSTSFTNGEIEPSLVNNATGSFVSVTQENTGSPHKGKRKRQATAGDISDFHISFNDGELDSMNTNIQSNIISPAANMMINKFVSVSNEKNAGNNGPYDSVIDSVARGEGIELTVDLDCRNRNQQQQGTFRSTTQPQNKSQARKDRRRKLEEQYHNNIVAGPSETRKLADNESVHKLTGYSLDTDYNSISRSVTSDIFREYESPLSGFSLGTSNSVADCTESQESQDILIEPEIPSDVCNVTLNANLMEKQPTSLKSNINQDDTIRKVASDVLVEESDKNQSNLRSSETIPPSNQLKPLMDIIVDFPSENDSNGPKGEQKQSSEIGESERKTDPAGPLVVIPDRAESPKVHFIPYFPTTWTDGMKEFYDCSRKRDFNMDRMWGKMTDAVSKWKSPMDSMPPPKNKNRHIRCDNCKQFGHLARSCGEKWKEPCCHMCGEEGHTSDHHSRRPCTEARCLNCGRPQDQYSQRCPRCLLNRNPRRCDICNVIGHGRDVCPDNWRRYHSITSHEEYEQAQSSFENHRKEIPKSDSTKTTSKQLYKTMPAMFCCNCGGRGHSFYDCYHNRFNPYHRNKPFVVRELPVVPMLNKPSPAAVPICYDSRTGRTVVMNTEANSLPEIAVETIQVKITNDLATATPASKPVAKTVKEHLKSQDKKHAEQNNKEPQTETCKELIQFKESGNPDRQQEDLPTNACKLNKGCSNKLRSMEQCTQSILMTQAHIKLLKAQENGVLKSFEEKHAVQISVINEGNKVHICGVNTSQAEKDMYRFLWMKESTQTPSTPLGSNNSVGVFNLSTPNEQTVDLVEDVSSASNSSDIKCNKRGLLEVVGGSSSPKEASSTEIITPPMSEDKTSIRTVDEDDVEDDDDDCLFIAELPVGVPGRTIDTASKSAIASLADEAKTTGLECSPPSYPLSMPYEPKDLSVIPEPTYFLDDAPVPGMYMSFETDADGRKSKTKRRPEKPNNLEQPNRSSPTESLCYMFSPEVRKLARPITPEIKTAAKVKPLYQSTLTFEHHKNKIPNASQAVNENKAPGNEKSKRMETLEKNSEKRQLQNSQSDVSLGDSPIAVIANIKSQQLASKQNANIEVITLDDEEETILHSEHEKRVTLLQSEWELVTSESMKKDNIMNEISLKFEVDLVVSKNASCVIITNGTEESRQIAKDNIVFWLECQSSNSLFKMLPPGSKNHEPDHEIEDHNVTPRAPKKKRKRVLQLKDVQPTRAGQTPIRKQTNAKKSKQMFEPFYGNSLYPDAGNQLESTSDNQTILEPHHSWTPGFNRKRFRESSMSPANANNGIVTPSPKKKKNKISNSPRSRFNYHPHKQRYYHPL